MEDDSGKDAKELSTASGRSLEYQQEAPEIRGGIRQTGVSKRLENAGGKHKRYATRVIVTPVIPSSMSRSTDRLTG
jgi:hypothetical protein